MNRVITLATGQWVDLPLVELSAAVASWGFSGLELACAGDHFSVEDALRLPGYVRAQRQVLEANGLVCYAISAHFIGQAVCDQIDNRHRSVLPPSIWGDGEPEGVRRRAAAAMKDTARAAAAFGAKVVTGFTGSSIWSKLYSFPPNDWASIEHAYTEFAERWGPIIDVFEQEGVRFALEVHPTEIAYDFVTTRKTLDAIGSRPGFGLNVDPSHLVPQFLDPAAFVDDFGSRVFHVHIKDARRRLDGRRSILSSHLPFGDPRRGWDFVSAGHGDVDFEGFIRALDNAEYVGPLSVEWEDSGMDRQWGVRDALQFVARLNFPSSPGSFEALLRRHETPTE